MDTAPTGGAAFPRSGYYPETEGRHREDFAHVLGSVTTPTAGMSLRDYFAGQALIGYLAAHAGDGISFPRARSLAIECWEYADAMIEQRGEPSTLPPRRTATDPHQVGEVPPIPDLSLPPIPPAAGVDYDLPDSTVPL